MTPQAFVHKWRTVQLKERSFYQEHFLDVCKLTNLYHQRPTWLVLAHEKLDKAVFNAYGWPHDLSEEEILGRLLELNLARSA